MLYGTGGSDLFTGFFKDANITTVLQTALPAGSTKLDLILYLITVVALAEYEPVVYYNVHRAANGCMVLICLTRPRSTGLHDSPPSLAPSY